MTDYTGELIKEGLIEAGKKIAAAIDRLNDSLDRFVPPDTRSISESQLERLNKIKEIRNFS